MSNDSATDPAIGDVLLDLAHRRGAGRSFCPSEAARALGGDWRARMGDVRVTAARLVADGRLVATQKGRPVDPVTARGPIRLGLAP